MDMDLWPKKVKEGFWKLCWGYPTGAEGYPTGDSKSCGDYSTSIYPNCLDLLSALVWQGLPATQEPQCSHVSSPRRPPHPEKCHWLRGFGGRLFISKDMKPMRDVSHCRSSRICPSRCQSVRVGCKAIWDLGNVEKNKEIFGFSQLDLQETPFPSFFFWFWSENFVHESI